MNFARLVRNNRIANSSALEAVIRGPKKKKGGAGGPAEITSEDVINIWKERTDPELNPINTYPIWLSHLLLPQLRFEQVAEVYMADEDILKPHNRDMKRLINQIRRFGIYEQNYTKLAKSLSLDFVTPARQEKDLFTSTKDEQEEEKAEGEEEGEEDED
ncbi:hypothetical protein ABPG74_005600 [Tetrahymena malaccensis]